jgi:hypothetical protein
MLSAVGATEVWSIVGARWGRAVLVRAGVDFPIPFSSAVPVETQRGGVVPELPIDGAQDGPVDLLDHLTRVQAAGGRH